MNNRFLFLYNPLKTAFRQNQDKVIDKILDFVEDGTKRYFLCQAPTGSGKSLIALTVARYLKYEKKKLCFITSSKNILLDQYAKDYDKYISIIKGKRNYPCLLMNNCTYEDAPCHLDHRLKCPRYTECPYKNALHFALHDNITFTNLHFLLLEMDYVKRFEKRDLLIIDEAHSVESILIDYRTVSYTEECIKKINKILEEIKKSNFILYKNTKKYYKGNYEAISADILKTINVDNLNEVESVLRKILHFVSNILNAMNDSFETDLLTSDTIKKHQKECTEFSRAQSYLTHLICKIENYLDNKDENEWICLPYFSKKTKKHTGFELKPIDATGLAKKILHKIADKVIFLSATIGDKEMFCKNIGIDSNISEYLSIDSDFPKENRPIYLSYIGTYNINTKEKYLKDSIEVIDKIIDSHPNMKGIIHTSNYNDADYIYQHSKHSNKILVHDSKDRNLVINRFINSTDKILCSPSCYEGLDLKDDLARFQIIFKIPWGNLGDKLVKKRMEKDKNWYVNLTAIQFCQAVGRAIRSKNDWANTFILDQSFERLKNSKYLTDYIKESII